MVNVLKFAGVVAAFVAAVAGVVWTTATAERAAAKTTVASLEAVDEMLASVLARESALRGYAQTRRRSFLEPYDVATVDLRSAADTMRELAGDEPAQLASLEQQMRLAERWADSANQAIVRVRSGTEIDLDTALHRSELIAQFRRHNDESRALIELAGERRHRDVLERAVLLVVVLGSAFAAAATLLFSRLRRHDQRRRQAERDEHARQQEFAETLQVTETEAEAHALVKRHLERSVPDSDVLVLNRNNSQNRLEAMTPVDAGSPLAARLAESTPSSCLAVRLGRTHSQSPEHEPLLACTLCGGGRTTCTPSLVGGQVIGSVLVTHPAPLDERELEKIEQSVSQAAPVLANLRNLAVAEIRASTDGLTGLANARALRDNLKRMLAQANRAGAPVAVIMCDLDHFKEINDLYGHERGDQALAAAAAALGGSIRESDIAGRFGGEEFLLLLPDTDVAGAVVLAEKLREELSRLQVAGVQRAVTASFGVAAFPQDAPEVETLLRTADRALYAAKARGRNCVVASSELLVETV